MRRSFAIVLLSVIVLASALDAQTIVTIDSGDEVGYSGVSNRHVVRASNGTLFMARIDSNVVGSRPIALGASIDGGLTWGDVIFTGINDPTTGESGSNLTSNVSLAIDDADTIHVTWLVTQSNIYYNQYYRTIDSSSFTLGPVVDLKASNGVATSVKTGGCGVIVDASNDVWVLCGSGTSWRAQLLQSDAPYNATNTFTSRGQLSVTSSAQNARLAVDSAGLIHTTYYEATGGGDHRHRAYDPATMTWSAATDIGDLVAANDYTSAIACDYLGNTHMICNRNSYTATGNPSVVYYKRDATGTFSGPITVTTAMNSQYNGIGNQHTISMACNELTGDVFVMYRDFAAGGSLEIAILPNGATAFAPYVTLGAPSTAQHHYYGPHMRGTLYPPTNNTGVDLDVTWREMWPAPYDLKFAKIGSATQPAYDGNGTAAEMSVSVNGSLSSPTTNVHSITSPTDLVALSYGSAGSVLDGDFFLSFGQIFPTGMIPAGIPIPGDAMGPLILDPSAPVVVIVESLFQFSLINPVIGATTFGFTFDPFLFGTGTSVIVTMICIDPAHVSNVAGYGNAEAHEFIIN